MTPEEEVDLRNKLKKIDRLAYIKGLERAKEILTFGEIHQGAAAAIQAEIEKVKNDLGD